MLNRYKNIDDMIAHLAPEESIYCICEQVLEQRARWFTQVFDGNVLYALKANPIRPVVDALYAGGIRHFDTASISEISTIAGWYDDAQIYFMHPVKSLRAIKEAWHRHGVRNFVVDHIDEVGKFFDVISGDTEGVNNAVLVVRMATPSDDARFNLSSKFGASPDETIELLRNVEKRGVRPGLCFHVGSQCITVKGYEAAFELAKYVLGETSVEIACLDVGGGFPVPYQGAILPPLQDYFDVISRGIEALSLPEACVLMCEPGRAMVAEGMSVVTQVLLRKDDSLYLGDGIHGTLGGARHGFKFPTRVIRPNGVLGKKIRAFTIFGPTCDSSDVIPYQMEFPVDIATGDWIELGLLGAYGPATRTDFNGFKPSTFCYVDEPFSY